MNTDSFHNTDSAKATTNSRREFLRSVSTAMIAQKLGVKASAATSAATKTFGIAYTSFPIRMRQSVQAMSKRGPSLPAERFIDLCQSFGAAGCQMDIAQLTSTDADYLKRIRAALEEKRMFLELSISSKVLNDKALFAQAAATARELGVSRLRVALLSGRRYENFAELKKWQDFVDASKETLRHIEPLLKHHKLLIGIENHKDWLADELAEMLGRISSRYLGACVDFGNNLALLEDSVEVAQKLAPYVVTTHLKDMAIKADDLGFELSEVALGSGFLALRRIVEILRKSRPDVHFCLEMITRDPLKVRYREDGYWSTFERRDTVRTRKFETTLLNKVSAQSLPRISDLASAQQMLATEDENIRLSQAYAKQMLKL